MAFSEVDVEFRVSRKLNAVVQLIALGRIQISNTRIMRTLSTLVTVRSPPGSDRHLELSRTAAKCQISEISDTIMVDFQL